MQDEPIRYSRSQCARLFGISMDTLRYYERIGLLHVARDKRSRQCVYIGRIIGKLVAQPAADNMQESVMDGRANYEPEKNEKGAGRLKTCRLLFDSWEMACGCRSAQLSVPQFCSAAFADDERGFAHHGERLPGVILGKDQLADRALRHVFGIKLD